MEVTKEWLETTGTKISAEDIRQMQLLYEQPSSLHRCSPHTSTAT
jgi:hypothetical protein